MGKQHPEWRVQVWVHHWSPFPPPYWKPGFGPCCPFPDWHPSWDSLGGGTQVPSRGPIHREVRKQSSGFYLRKQALKWRTFPKHQKDVQKMLATARHDKYPLECWNKMWKALCSDICYNWQIRKQVTILRQILQHGNGFMFRKLNLTYFLWANVLLYLKYFSLCMCVYLSHDILYAFFGDLKMCSQMLWHSSL